MTQPSSNLFEGAEFRKSSKSSPNGPNCVEVAKVDGFYGVRDSKDAKSPVLVFTNDEWVAFVGGVRDGEFG